MGLQHARLGQGVRRGKPDHADHPVHPRRSHGAGHGRGGCDPDARGGAGGHGVLPDRATGSAGDLRFVRIVDVDADGCPDIRDAGAAAGPVRARGACASSGRPVPEWRQLHRIEGARLPGGIRERHQLHGHDAGRGELQPPHGGLARGRSRDRLREVHPRRGSGVDGQQVPRGRRRVGEWTGARGDAAGRPGPAFPGFAAHAGQLRDRVLALGAGRQQQLRAVGAQRVAGRRAARERALEAASRRV